MKPTELFTADESKRAVSPVIGVILMVAITVILAAVIGTFVLGLGDQVQESAPSAQWNWDASPGSSDLSITHEGGASVTPGNLEVTDTSNTLSDVCSTDGGSFQEWSGSDDSVTAGDDCQIANSANSGQYVGGETARLIWSAEGGGQSSTLSTFDVPT